MPTIEDVVKKFREVKNYHDWVSMSDVEDLLDLIEAMQVERWIAISEASGTDHEEVEEITWKSLFDARANLTAICERILK